MSGGNEFDKQQFFELFLNPEVPFSYKFWLVAGAGLYTITPVDFLPEAVLGPLGFADDVGALLIAAQIFTHFANKRLEEKHEQEQAPQVIQQPAQPTNSVYRAHNAPPPQSPAQPTTPPPRVIQNRQRADLPTEDRPQQPTTPAPSGDFLRDEWHEQLIEQKRQQTDAQFDDVVRQKEQQQHPPQDWDFDRNNPFSKKKP